DGNLKRAVQLAQAVLQNVREADENGKRDSTENERVYQFFKIDRARGVFVRVHTDVAVFVDGKVSFAPTGHVVQPGGPIGGQPFRRLQNHRALPAVSFQ